MEIPVLVEPVAGNGFRASSGQPLPLSAEGATPDDAVRNLRAEMARQLQNGKQLLAIRLPEPVNPWLAAAGIHDPSDSLIQEWKDAMAEYRQEFEDDPNRP